MIKDYKQVPPFWQGSGIGELRSWNQHLTSKWVPILQVAHQKYPPNFTKRSWSNYSDLTRPHPKWWFSKGNTLISGKPRLVKYYNLARKKLHEDGHEDSHSSIGQRVNDKSMGIFGVGSTLQGFGSQEIDLLGLYLEDHPRTCKWLVTPI